MPVANRPWVIVFDLDDTLYPEADFVRSGFTAVDGELQNRGIRGFAPLANSLFQQGARGKIFDLALAELATSVPPALIAELVQVYRAHLPQLSLFPDARWALDYYAARTKVALLTDGYAATQRNKVAGLGLQNVFAAKLFTDDLGPKGWKPSVVPFLELAAMLEMSESMELLVYVADNPIKDFIAPNQLGWKTVRIKRPGGEYASLEPRETAHAPQHEIDSLEGLSSVLRWPGM
jgi:putative hydrolase of the HAD superfamily